MEFRDSGILRVWYYVSESIRRSQTSEVGAAGGGGLVAGLVADVQVLGGHGDQHVVVHLLVAEERVLVVEYHRIWKNKMLGSVRVV